MTIRSSYIARADVGRFLASIPDAEIDLQVLDPGYGMNKDDWDAAPGYDSLLFREVKRTLKSTGTAYVFGPLGTLVEMYDVFPRPKRLVIWNVSNRVVPAYKTWQPVAEGIVMLTKGRTPYFDREAAREPYSAEFQRQRGRRRPGTKGRFGSRESTYSMASGALGRDVLRGPGLSGRIGAREGLGHSCQKPLWLAERLVAASCPPAGLTLDLFAGTSTFAVAAHSLGRRWISVEQDEHWCDVSLKRLHDAGAEAEIVAPLAPSAVSDIYDWKSAIEAEVAALKDAVSKLNRDAG